jgi:hypothetical protein
VGVAEGSEEGIFDKVLLGKTLGNLLTLIDGALLVIKVGLIDAIKEGSSDGSFGNELGLCVCEGSLLNAKLGLVEGVEEGTTDSMSFNIVGISLIAGDGLLVDEREGLDEGA